MSKESQSQPSEDTVASGENWKPVPVGQMTKVGDRIMQRDKKWHRVGREFTVTAKTRVERKVES